MNDNRLDKLERQTGINAPDLVEVLTEAGIGEERAEELTGPDGISYDRMTVGELDALAPRDEEVVPGGPTWGDLTVEQLDRIASGEPPRTVFRESR